MSGFYTEANQLYDSYIEAFALERKRCFYEYSGVFYVEDATEEQQTTRMMSRLRRLTEEYP